MSYKWIGVDLRFGHRTTALRNYVNLAVPTMPLLVADKRGAAETKIIANGSNTRGSRFCMPTTVVWKGQRLFKRQRRSRTPS
jgi:hypothetical protein